MDITQELAEAKLKRQELINKTNELAEQGQQIQAQRQQVLQEALKMDGEVRILERMAKQEGDG